jgi:hypothetical protein
MSRVVGNLEQSQYHHKQLTLCRPDHKDMHAKQKVLGTSPSMHFKLYVILIFLDSLILH